MAHRSASSPGSIFPPFGFSRTDFAVNPHPLFVAWGGAFWGCILPLAILAVARCFAAKTRIYLLAWFAGFCLSPTAPICWAASFLTGGADDGGVILQDGGSRWQLVALRRCRPGRRIVSLERPRPLFRLRTKQRPGRSQSRRRRDDRLRRRCAVGVVIASHDRLAGTKTRSYSGELRMRRHRLFALTCIGCLIAPAAGAGSAVLRLCETDRQRTGGAARAARGVRQTVDRSQSAAAGARRQRDGRLRRRSAATATSAA